MANTKLGGLTLKQRMIAKFGSEDAYKAYMRSIAAKGGKLGTTGGFFADRDLARRAGAKGGRISRRKTLV